MQLPVLSFTKKIFDLRNRNKKYPKRDSKIKCHDKTSRIKSYFRFRIRITYFSKINQQVLE